MRRREFIKLALATSLLGACGRGPAPRIGLALGGGGANGLAHIPMLEVLDELGVRPHRISGTSIGAIIGALYAAGKSGKALRQIVDRLIVTDNESWLTSLFTEDVGRWFDFIELKLGKGGLVDSSAFIAYLQEQLQLSRFDQLQIPLKLVTTDFWSRNQVVLSSGDLLSAIKASMAVPGLFEPVAIGGRLLVDGGLVNPVPYDLLLDECDYVIAVDVIGERRPDSEDGPGYFDVTFNTFQIMQSALMQAKRKLREPDLYLKPNVANVRMLEFYKADKIYAQAESERQRLYQALRRKMKSVRL